MKKLWIYSLAVLGVFSILLTSCEKNENTGVAPSIVGGKVTDVDDNTYSTVTIGSQTWMRENLKVTKFRDGTAIPNLTDNTQWKNSTTPGYCVYGNNTSYKTTYGCLYNWYAINDSRNIAPVGWHIPTDEDWATLVEYLGGENVAGNHLKETGITHWIKPNDLCAVNTYNFTALPGGMRNGNGFFSEMTTTAYWWSSINLLSEAYFRKLVYNDIYVGRDLYYLNAGLSVRCVRD
jgi:uncharacterized protein (TIGR02145 family)